MKKMDDINEELAPFLISMSLQSMVYPLTVAYAWMSWKEPTSWLDAGGETSRCRFLSLRSMRYRLKQ